MLWPKPDWDPERSRLGNRRLPEGASICRKVISRPVSTKTPEAQVQWAVAGSHRFFKA